MSAYRINSGDLPTANLDFWVQTKKHKVIPIDEYVDSMGNSKYDAEVIEPYLIFKAHNTLCV